MSVYSYFVAFCVVALLLILAYIGWWIYIHTSPFHVAVNRIPEPKYLPLIGNALGLAGGLDRESQIFFLHPQPSLNIISLFIDYLRSANCWMIS
jgi:hypothetical protein